MDQYDYRHLTKDLYNSKKSLSKALEPLRKAIIEEPGNAQLYEILGAALSVDKNCERAQADEAIEAYRAALRLRPSYANVHYGLALIYLKRNDMEAAISELQAAVNGVEGNGLYYYGHGRAYHTLAQIYRDQGDIDKCIATYREVVKWHHPIGMGEDVDSIMRGELAFLLLDHGNFAEAIQEFREAIRMRAYADLHHGLAKALYATGQFESALEEIQKYLVFDPKSKDAKETRQLIMEAKAKLP